MPNNKPLLPMPETCDVPGCNKRATYWLGTGHYCNKRGKHPVCRHGEYPHKCSECEADKALAADAERQVTHFDAEAKARVEEIRCSLTKACGFNTEYNDQYPGVNLPPSLFFETPFKTYDMIAFLLAQLDAMAKKRDEERAKAEAMDDKLTEVLFVAESQGVRIDTYKIGPFVRLDKAVARINEIQEQSTGMMDFLLTKLNAVECERNEANKNLSEILVHYNSYAEAAGRESGRNLRGWKRWRKIALWQRKRRNEAIAELSAYREAEANATVEGIIRLIEEYADAAVEHEAHQGRSSLNAIGTIRNSIRKAVAALAAKTKANNAT